MGNCAAIAGKAKSGALQLKNKVLNIEDINIEGLPTDAQKFDPYNDEYIVNGDY